MRLMILTASVSVALLTGVASAREGVRLVPGTSGVAPAPARTETAAPRPAMAQPAASTSAAPAQSSVDRGALQVTVNRAKVIRLPEKAQTVIVGNPAIADLSLQKNGIVVVTGKSYGSTNLIALDGAGQMLAESLVNVVAQSDGLVVVQRAFDRYSYSCNPNCQPSVNLGDNKTYFDDSRGQADSHNAFAVSR